jgi:hypothetical protein
LANISWQIPSIALMAMLIATIPACSLKKVAINKLGDALAGSGSTFSSDDDPEFIEGAVPFSLKLTESLLAESPNHRGMLIAAASGFTRWGGYASLWPGRKSDRARTR